MRPLWQILISITQRNQPVSLDCDECFQYLEHLAEEALAGAEKDTLQEAIKDHLVNCPDCLEHHMKRLDLLETKFLSEEDTLQGTPAPKTN
jgi:hypothetical protein